MFNFMKIIFFYRYKSFLSHKFQKLRRSLSRHRSKNLYKPVLKYKYTKNNSLKKFAKEDDKIKIKSNDNPTIFFVENLLVIQTLLKQTKNLK